MARNLTTRLALLLLTVFGVATLTFILQFVLPGDPARALVPRFRDAAALEQIRESLHLNDPLWDQYTHYLEGVARGDLGESYVQHDKVTTIVFARLSATLVLAAAGVVVEASIGVPLGMWSALRRTGQSVASVVNLALLSIPAFVLGLLLLLVFGYDLHLFPVIGGAGPQALVLPALTLGLIGVPYYSQIVSEEMTQALASPYVRTGISKGLSNRQIIVHHTLRNVSSPVVTLIGLDLGQYISGVVVVEAVFNWPGIGQLAVQSLNSLDRPVVLGIALLAAIGVGLFNFIADLIRMIIDPRTREQRV